MYEGAGHAFLNNPQSKNAANRDAAAKSVTKTTKWLQKSCWHKSTIVIFRRLTMANKWDERKKAQEDEYFVKKGTRAARETQSQSKKLRLKSRAQKTSHMKCPKCGASLKERSFQKIQIDQCTGCNGIWLDAGELEQVAEKDNSSWLGKFWQKNG